MELNIATLSDFVKNAQILFMKGLDSIKMETRNSGIFRVDNIPDYTGNTKEVTTALSHASSIGAYTVGITQMSKSKLSKICSSLLYVPTEEKELRLGAILSRNSSLIITDLLYYGITKSDIDQSKESLKTTRSIIEELR